MMEKKKFAYAENLVFSFFDFLLVNNLVGGLKVDGSFTSVGSNDQNFPLMEYDEAVDFLFKNKFELADDDCLQNYFLKIESHFISSNKNTLLVFRRVG